MNLNLTLRLYLPGEWPSAEPACEWALLNAQGVPLQRGKSEPRHWPAAETCEVVLTAEQCLVLQAQLPKGARARAPEVISYALEEQLIGETETEHFVVGDAPADQPTPVWVITRNRLRTILAAFNTLERPPQRIISEIQLAPLTSGNWSVCLRADNAIGFLRLGTEAGSAFDLADPGMPPVELQLAVDAARQNDRLPLHIDVHSARSKASPFDQNTAQAWETRLGVSVRLAGEYNWRDIPAREARNFLTGEFAPPRSAHAGWGSFKPALWLALATVLVYTLFSLGEWFWLEGQSQDLRQQMLESFRAAYPQAQNIVDPPLQMQRLSDQLHRARGQLGSTDFLPLLAATSEALGSQGQVRNLGYEDGRLEITVLLTDTATQERLHKALTSRGLAVTLRDSRPATGGIEAVFAVRGSP